MPTYKYSFQGYDKEKMARVVGRDLSVSTKDSIELCTFIKGRSLQKAKELLEGVVRMEVPVPFRRFTEGAGHKRGKIAAGNYPVKISIEVLNLLNTLEANAQQKGLNTSNLMIKHACANKASRPPRYGRQRGRMAKRSHIELIAAEGEEAMDVKGAKEAKEKKTGRHAAAKDVAKDDVQEKKADKAENKAEKSEKNAAGKASRVKK